MVLQFPKIDPIAFSVGPLQVHWYGITYLVAFGLFLFLANLRLKHQPYASIQGPGAWSRRDIDDMLFLGVMGVIVGGRLGYCLFYKPAYYAMNPLEIFGNWRTMRRLCPRSQCTAACRRANSTKRANGPAAAPRQASVVSHCGTPARPGGAR